jgi:viroplasmin and RNaseH domain-containing protein
MKRRAEIDRDLEVYLSARRKKGFNIKGFLSSLLPKPKPKKVEMPEKVEVYSEETVTDDEAAIEEIIEDREKKPGFLSKIFGLREEKPDEEELIQAKLEAEESLNDMKEVAKVCLTVIKKHGLIK